MLNRKIIIVKRYVIKWWTKCSIKLSPNPCVMTASGPFNCCRGCVKNFIFFTDSNIAIRASMVSSFYLPIIYTEPIFQKYYHATNNYVSLIQSYPYISPIWRSGLLNILLVKNGVFFTYSQPSVFSPPLFRVYSLFPLPQQW